MAPKPSQTQEAHFDVPALLNAVAEQDIGLRIQTNNPAGFKRILYMAMERLEGPRCHIYAVPGTKASFCLLRQPLSEGDVSAQERDVSAQEGDNLNLNLDIDLLLKDLST